MPDPKAPQPFTPNEMLELAANAVRKVDISGQRGATLVTQEEIVAMAGMLVCLGLKPYPDQPEGPAEPAFATRREKA